MKAEKIKRPIKVIAFFVPFVLALFGFLSTHEMSFADAAFQGVILYFMNYGDTPPNIWVEIARWLAPLATASGLVMAFVSIRERARRGLRYLSGNSICVYGDGRDAEEMLAQLGSRGIRGPEGELVRAERYILMYAEEEKNYDFYCRYMDRLQEKQVYVKSAALRPQDAKCRNLHFFQYEEAEARTYWKEHSLLEEAAASDYKLKIVLIGGGKLCEALLTEGVQKNIFNPDQKIAYHVFDAGEKFTACHPGFQDMGDPVIFHGEAWYQCMDCIRQADRILVADQEKEVEYMKDLLAVVPQKRIDFFSRKKNVLKMLFASPNLHVYDAEREGRKIENILNEKLFEQAKQLNLNYAVMYGSAAAGEASASNEAVREAEWRKLDGFTRYSNVSSVDYHEIRKQMLQKLTGSDRTDESAYQPYLELFAELEHIRWCRYHLLNGWTYGIPESGKAKDTEQRIHRSLIPYRELSETEKEKDRETVRCMFQWQ